MSQSPVQVPFSQTRTTGKSSREVKPFLKWAGGKSQLLPVLRTLVPRSFKRYFEPFLGGGALFFDLRCENATLSDSNEELMACYQVVQRAPSQLIAKLSRCSVDAEEFYRMRGLDPDALSELDRAVRFIYLNKTCFNGLYRVNRQGRFNTPFGACKNARLIDEENLYRVSSALQDAQLLCDDYGEVLKRATRGDFVYLDPPYLPISEYSDFKRYTPAQFYESDHVRLAEVFRVLDKRGCAVLLSNSFHPKIKGLYRGYRQRTVSAARFINCKGGGRGEISELLITNY